MDPIYKDHIVTVTNSLVQVSDGTTYQIRQINSTKVTFEDPPRFGPSFLGFLVGAAIGGVFSAMVSSIPVLKHIGAFAPVVIGGGVAYKVWSSINRKYYIALSTSSGEVKGFNSPDVEWVNKVNAAILEAMTKAA